MDDTDDIMTSRVMLKGKEVENEDLEKEKWKKQLSDHKMLVFIVITSYLSKTNIITSLAENIHNLLEIFLSPSVLLSLQNIPTKLVMLMFGSEPTRTGPRFGSKFKEIVEPNTRFRSRFREWTTRLNVTEPGSNRTFSLSFKVELQIFFFFDVCHSRHSKIVVPLLPYPRCLAAVSL